MRLKDLAPVIMALAALVSSVTGLVTALQAKQEVQAVDERLYRDMADVQGENADRLAALERKK
jgi:uncharacterized protein (DUF1697 family)